MLKCRVQDCGKRSFYKPMYNRFFGFKERPFKLVPNPAFLYLSRIHEEVLAHLNYAVGYGEGFVEITGEVGTGKTTLCRLFLENLDENTEAAYIFNPKLDALQLLKAINDEFGIASDADSVKTLIDQLNTFLLEKKAQGRQVILLVDEAQNLNADVLEQLRLLSNLETNTSKLIQIILVGQPELGELLETEQLRQLNQRITLSCHLIPLDFNETREYIRHRIHIASSKPGPSFSARAYRTIFKHTNGIPRLINIACDRALLTAYTQGKQQISNQIVRQAIHELDRKKWRYRSPLVSWYVPAIGLVVILAAIAIFFVPEVLNRKNHSQLPPVVSTQPESPADQAGIQNRSQSVNKAGVDMADLPPAPEPLADEPPAASSPASVQEVTGPTPQATDNTLENAILSMDMARSRKNAMQTILQMWGKLADVDTVLQDDADADDNTFFRLNAQRSNLEVLRIQGNLSLIKKLNLPAIMEFPHPDGSGICFLTVTALDENEIQLSANQTRYRIEPQTIAWLWNGAAHIFWDNRFNYQGVIPTSSPGDSIIALKVHLKALGFEIKEMTAAYDANTRRAVETIQARNGLVVDGKVGPMTQIALYSEDRSLGIPRLDAVSDEGRAH
jgi:general secretion pathway protein A